MFKAESFNLSEPKPLANPTDQLTKIPNFGERGRIHYPLGTEI